MDDDLLLKEYLVKLGQVDVVAKIGDQIDGVTLGQWRALSARSAELDLVRMFPPGLRYWGILMATAISDAEKPAPTPSSSSYGVVLCTYTRPCVVWLKDVHESPIKAAKCVRNALRADLAMLGAEEWIGQPFANLRSIADARNPDFDRFMSTQLRFLPKKEEPRRVEVSAAGTTVELRCPGRGIVLQLPIVPKTDSLDAEPMWRKTTEENCWGSVFPSKYVVDDLADTASAACVFSITVSPDPYIPGLRSIRSLGCADCPWDADAKVHYFASDTAAFATRAWLRALGHSVSMPTALSCRGCYEEYDSSWEREDVVEFDDDVVE